MSKVHCKDCLYWKRTGPGDVGECKRYPPVLVNKDYVDSWAGWVCPVTDGMNWCGEYKSDKDEQ